MSVRVRPRPPSIAKYKAHSALSVVSQTLDALRLEFRVYLIFDAVAPPHRQYLRDLP